jgi:hypothetical protein
VSRGLLSAPACPQVGTGRFPNVPGTALVGVPWQRLDFSTKGRQLQSLVLGGIQREKSLTLAMNGSGSRPTVSIEGRSRVLGPLPTLPEVPRHADVGHGYSAGTGSWLSLAKPQRPHTCSPNRLVLGALAVDGYTIKLQITCSIRYLGIFLSPKIQGVGILEKSRLHQATYLRMLIAAKHQMVWQGPCSSHARRPTSIASARRCPDLESCGRSPCGTWLLALATWHGKTRRAKWPGTAGKRRTSLDLVSRKFSSMIAGW